MLLGLLGLRLRLLLLLLMLSVMLLLLLLLLMLLLLMVMMSRVYRHHGVQSMIVMCRHGLNSLPASLQSCRCRDCYWGSPCLLIWL